jgi:hypothetical protein
VGDGLEDSLGDDIGSPSWRCPLDINFIGRRGDGVSMKFEKSKKMLRKV